MLRITICIMNVLAFLALSAQDCSTAPPIEAPDSLVFRLNGNELYGTLMRPTIEFQVSWHEAGEAEFAVILDLDDTGRVSSVESIAFGGSQAFVQTSVRAFKRYLGLQLVEPDDDELRKRYILPVIVREGPTNDPVYPVEFSKLLAKLAAPKNAGLFPPASIWFRPPTRCYATGSKVIPPWEKQEKDKKQGATLSARKIKALGRRENRN